MPKTNMKNNKKQNIVQDVIHSIYDIKNVVSFSRKGFRGFISFICIMSMLITMFTAVIPMFRVISQMQGVSTIINIMVPDFSYKNKELSTEYFNCDIDEEKNTMFMIDTSRTFDNIVLEEYNKALVIDKDHFAYKTEDGVITSKYFSEYLGDKEISRQWILDHVYYIYIFLGLVVFFCWFFIALSFIFTAFILGILVLLVNKFFVKLKNITFMQSINISLYCLGFTSVVKGILSCFNYALYLSPFEWYTVIQVPVVIILIVLSLKQFKLNNYLVEKLNEDLSDEDGIDEELGFSEEDKEYRDAMKKSATDLKKTLKEEINKSTKNNKEEE